MEREDRTPNLNNDYEDLFTGNFYLKSDIYEEENNYILEIDVPGVTKDNINIECLNGYLTVSILNGLQEGETSRNYLRRERRYAEYHRQFYLGNVDCNNIVANYNDGTLKIILPKQAELKNSKKINIE